MDAIDKTIMVEICTNCRVSYESLARQTGLSSNAVKNRVTSLLESGTIHRWSVSLQPEMIGGEYFLALVTTDGTESIDAFVSNYGNHPSIGHISLLASAGGGAYFVWGEYIGSHMLLEMRSFLSEPEEVVNVELHTTLHRRGKKVELAKLHLRILSVLRRDPRVQVNDLAKELGLAPKTVRRGIKEIVEGGGIAFSARPDMATGRFVNFFVRFEYDEKAISAEEVADWLQERYPVELWDPTPSATFPVFFSEFVVENLHEAEKIAREIRDAPFVKSTSTLISYSNQKFPYIAETMLDDMIKAAGL